MSLQENKQPLTIKAIETIYTEIFNVEILDSQNNNPCFFDEYGNYRPTTLLSTGQNNTICNLITTTLETR